MKISKISLKFILIFCLILISAKLSDVSLANLTKYIFARMTILSVLTVLAVYSISLYLVAFRLWLGYKQFQAPISYRTAISAVINGQLAGVIPIFGAVFGQSVKVNRDSGISTTTGSFIFFYDKVLMAISGLLLCAIAGYLIYGHLAINMLFNSEQLNNNSANNVMPLELFAAILICLAMVYKFGLSKKNKRSLLAIVSKRNLLYLMANLICCVLAWLLSAACFVICIHSLTAESITSNILILFFISLAVSFVSSMPLSVNGWGLREFAAISLFALVAIPKQSALMAAISVGILSTLALILNAGISVARKY